jgi:hypothetical protein
LCDDDAEKLGLSVHRRDAMSKVSKRLSRKRRHRGTLDAEAGNRGQVAFWSADGKAGSLLSIDSQTYSHLHHVGSSLDNSAGGAASLERTGLYFSLL